MAEPDAEHDAGLPVGKHLRQVREARGLQLDEASRVTKISKSYLVAIEEGQFEKLPNAAYIKGFLRLYAGFLGLSGDEVVRHYERDTGALRPQPEVRAEQERPRSELVERARLGGRGRWVIPLLLLGLVVVAALFLNEGEDKRGRQSAKPAETPAAPPVKSALQPQRSSAVNAPGAAPAAGAPAAAPGTQPGTAPAGSPGTVPGAPPGSAQAPVTATAPPPGGRGVVLRLRFNQDSWLSITIDDAISQRYDLKAGDIIEWKGARSFVLDLGDGAAAEGEFNGRPLKPFGEAGKPAHAELKAAAPGNQESKER